MVSQVADPPAFDRTTGALRLTEPPIELSAWSTCRSLQAAGLEPPSGWSSVGAGQGWVDLGACRLGDVTAAARLHFFDGRLEAVELSFIEPDFDEDALDRVHAAWLCNQLGAEHVVADWGEASHGLDPKNGEASIVIRYAWLGSPWAAIRPRE
ncbi:MAG: hypothetical protein N3F11_06460 [Casimicrobiaceae bacterium]|nr:hypothetical protein [Casimicrobiaceae bacterium]